MVVGSKRQAAQVMRVLRRRYPKRRRGEVASAAGRRPFEVMVSAIISQRNRDEVTEKVAGGLLRKASNPSKMAKLERREIAKTIRSANFYKTKSKHIHEAAKMIVKDFGGRMPATRVGLMRLPGVGGKTADIIMLVSHGAGVIPVDTHVEVVARRLGWTKEKEPERIRADLHMLFPLRARGYVNMLLVEFGKELCRMHMPRCYACPVVKLCPYPSKNMRGARR